MNIETRWNISDEAWAVEECQYGERFEFQCPDCNGQGGATIPGTKLRMKCERCDETGKLHLTKKRCYLTRVRVDGINISIFRRRELVTEVSYCVTVTDRRHSYNRTQLFPTTTEAELHMVDVVARQYKEFEEEKRELLGIEATP